MRGTCPNTASYAAWLPQPGAGGSATTTQAMTAMNSTAAVPAQITRRARA